MLVSKASTLSLFKANVFNQPTFSRSSSYSLRTESQIQCHFDVETVRFAKLFVKAGWHALRLFIPKRVDKLFLDVVHLFALILNWLQANY